MPSGSGSNQINSLYSKILSGDAESYEKLKEMASQDPNAAYYVAEIYNKGYFKNQVDEVRAFAYYGLAVYLGHEISKENLKRSKDPRAKRCLQYLRNLGYDDNFDVERLVTALNKSPTTSQEEFRSFDQMDPQTGEKLSPVKLHLLKRDEYNRKSKEYSEKRNEYNLKVKEQIKTLNEIIEQRNNYNQLAKEAKIKRNKLQEDLKILQLNPENSKKPSSGESKVYQCKKEGDAQHKLVIEYSDSAQICQEKIVTIRQEIELLRYEANNAHYQFIEYKNKADTEQQLYLKEKEKVVDTKSSRPIPTSEELDDQVESESNTENNTTIFLTLSNVNPSGENVFFIDFSRYLDSAPAKDNTYGSSLNEQFRTTSLKTKYLDAAELFQDVFVKEKMDIYISSPNFIKDWERDRKYPELKYLKNIAIRVQFTNTHDLVLMTNLVFNTAKANVIGYRLEVKGFIFVDTNTKHSGELKLIGKPVTKIGGDKNAMWMDYNGLYQASSFHNCIDNTVLSFLNTHYITDNSECIEYMQNWKKYLASRTHVLEVNESQKINITSVNLQAATFCDECTEEIRTKYEPIPFLNLVADKKQGWFVGNIDEDNCRRVLLMHITKEYGNDFYQKYVDKTDISFKKQFDQFTRDGLKLFGKLQVSSNEDDEFTNPDELIGEDNDESVINTYDTRISNVFVQIINPDEKIQKLQVKYSSKRENKIKELSEKKDSSIDSAQKQFRNEVLPELLEKYKQTLSYKESDLDAYIEANGLKPNDITRSEKKADFEKEIVGKEASRLAELNFENLRKKFEPQYLNAVSDFDNNQKLDFEDEKTTILRNGSTICLHAYFDLSDDYDLSDETKIKHLNETIQNLQKPYIRRNLDGDRILLRRQAEGINNLLNGFVMNPYLCEELFSPQQTVSDTYAAYDEIELYQNLNPSQKEAVLKAIESNGLFLIQGPPGTGKTQTIAEIATQLAKSGKKILIASQNNKAVDNAFSRLPELPDIRPVRVLRDIGENLYSYKNLTDNLYKNIVGSLKRKIKKNSDEHKYVEESNNLIEKLTQMKDTIESTENQIGDLEKDIRDNEVGLKEILNNLTDIRQHINDCQLKEEEYLNKSELLSKGQYDNYSALIKTWPEKLSSLPPTEKDALLRTILNYDEDAFMDALIDSENIDDDDEEDGNNKRMPMIDVINLLKQTYGEDNLVEIVDLYRDLTEDIRKESEKQNKNAILYQKQCSQYRKQEKNIEDQLSSQEKLLNGLKQDKIYQHLLQDRDRFKKEINRVFTELEIAVDTDEESAIEVIKRTIAKIKNKLANRKSNLEGRISAYKQIVDYLSDEDVIATDRARVNDSILKYVNVIGITCSKASSGTSIRYMSADDQEMSLKLNQLNIDVVILDETSKVPFSELVPPILYGKTVILVGDHRQLPPVYSEIKKEDMELYDENIVNPDDEIQYKEMYTDSFFGKLFNSSSDRWRSTLTVQYRMHPQIMELVNTFYPDTPLTFGGNIFQKEHRITIPGANGNILDPEKHVLFINCTGKEKRESGTMSSYNQREAEAVVSILNLLNDNCEYNRDGVPLTDLKKNNEDTRLSIGVICPYKGQVNRIRDLKKSSYHSFNQSYEEKFMISTVDNFQGDERDIIVLSMVRTVQCDWLSEYRRINVAISRARRLLIIVGNESGLSNINVAINTNDGPVVKKAYREIIHNISKQGGYINSFDIVGGQQ